MLWAVSDFVDPNLAIIATPTYWYEGHCPSSQVWLRLPRTAFVEAIAHGLMQQLAASESASQPGKMYGVLLVATASGERRVLKAFSGLLHGESCVPGWVPPIPGRSQVAIAEASTLVQLEAIKTELLSLQQLPERQQLEQLTQAYDQCLQELTRQHHEQKQQRHQRRQALSTTLIGSELEIALTALDEQSRQAGIERRRLKQQRDTQLQPLKQIVDQSNLRLQQLKQARKTLSRRLQAQMHDSYWLTNFAGISLPLQQLMQIATMPTGTGDCCAPKLLHYAAAYQLKPLAMAEFWWGLPAPNGDKLSGKFYGACRDRCQPLLGFLLSDFGTHIKPLQSHVDAPLPLLYEDEWLIAVNKPVGLLSVPGRYRDRQDSVLTRLRHQRPNETLLAVHRLDQATSGILLLARDPQTHCLLSRQFQQRQVQKVYEAILAGAIAQQAGVIELPLWSDPSDRPYQKVDWQRGKPSTTKFQVIATTNNQTRIEFLPITGRTHQLRVHAANPNGLGIPILGDRLYGCHVTTQRLHLHARELHCQHPQETRQALDLVAITPY